MSALLGPSRRRVRGRALVAALAAAALFVAAATVSIALAPPAGAASDGGASSRVVGRGDIVTSIIGWRTSSPRAGRGAAAPRCRWVTLTDTQIEWLAAASAHSVAGGGPSHVLETVRHLLAGGELPDGDLQARVCAGVTVDLRFVPRTGPPASTEVLYRRMITRLPAPDPTWSPPPSVAVPVGQPVFVSIPEQGWRPIENTITVDGITARVRARPVGVRVISGDPDVPAVVCAGPGRPFDDRIPVSVREQAADPAACTVTYRTATSPAPRSGAGTDSGGADARPARPAAWIGTVTVLWQAEWRAEGVAGAGPDEAWIQLGVIPRTRLYDRPTRELLTTIESRR